MTADVEHLAGLGRAAQASRAAAAALRWLAACAVGFSCLLLLSVGLAGFERSSAAGTSETSASAYLDFDLSVLRELGDRTLAGQGGDLQPLWAQRPPWRVADAPAAAARMAPLRDAWAAAVSDRSRFRTVARGTADALPFLLGGLALALLSAAAAAAAGPRARAACMVAFVLPLSLLLDPGAFYDRTRSLGAGVAAALFVATFAAALPGAALRAVLLKPAARLPALAGGPLRGLSARLAAIDAVLWLIPAVPALSAAALFVCVKADQDPAARGAASGFGGLVRAAMAEPGVADRLASCALLASGLALLSFLGHRFLVETRSALSASGEAP